MIDKTFRLMLKAAYQYYWLDDPIMTDYEYDNITKLLACRLTDDPYSHLVDFDALQDCSSLHYIPRKDYPEEIIK